MKIPEKLAFVVVAVALSSCGSDPQVKQQSLCPSDWFCSTDAARAFNCSDLSPDPFQSDLGFCSPPV